MKNLNQTKKSKSGHDDGYFDDCPICQAMKKEGIKMQRYSDGTGNDGVWDKGFYTTPIDPKKTEKIKKIFKQHGGVVVDKNTNDQ